MGLQGHLNSPFSLQCCAQKDEEGRSQTKLSGYEKSPLGDVPKGLLIERSWGSRASEDLLVDLAADDQALDLRGALVDLEDLGVAVELLDGLLL